MDGEQRPTIDVAETVTDAVRLLQAQGFADDVRIDADGVHCPSCGHCHRARHIVVHHQYRYEGESDPGDSMIVLGVECPECRARGIIVSAFGADADDQLVELSELLGPA